jgi:hypothetical protein
MLLLLLPLLLAPPPYKRVSPHQLTVLCRRPHPSALGCASRSRERKAERIAGLRSEAERLGSTNFVLLKCVEEVASKALHARAEQHQLKVGAAAAVCRQRVRVRSGGGWRPQNWRCTVARPPLLMLL